jgi:hypothetical protein
MLLIMGIFDFLLRTIAWVFDDLTLAHGCQKYHTQKVEKKHTEVNSYNNNLNFNTLNQNQKLRIRWSVYYIFQPENVTVLMLTKADKEALSSLESASYKSQSVNYYLMDAQMESWSCLCAQIMHLDPEGGSGTNSSFVP